MAIFILCTLSFILYAPGEESDGPPPVLDDLLDEGRGSAGDASAFAALAGIGPRGGGGDGEDGGKAARPVERLATVDLRRDISVSAVVGISRE